MVITIDKTNGGVLWDMQTVEHLLSLPQSTDVLAAPWTFVNSTAFSADGKKIVTAGNNDTAVLWDAETGERLHTIYHRNARFATFNPDGTMVITASIDKTAVVWNTETGERLLSPTSWMGQHGCL